MEGSVISGTIEFDGKYVSGLGPSLLIYAVDDDVLIVTDALRYRFGFDDDILWIDGIAISFTSTETVSRFERVQ